MKLLRKYLRITTQLCIFTSSKNNNTMETTNSAVNQEVTKTYVFINADMIKNYAEKTGKKIQEYGATSRIKFGTFEHGRYNMNYSEWSPYMIGIEMKSGVWYWWKSFNDDGYNDTHLHFSERYNMANGASQTTFHKGYVAEQEMKRVLKINE